MLRLVGDLRSVFVNLDPVSGVESVTKTILIVFPRVTDETAPRLIDGLQAKLKPEFVDDGLMLGQFHSMNNEPGLWNDQFRPLRSPIPLLAIRFMVGGDIPFLKRQTDDVALRLRFISGYIRACTIHEWPTKWRHEAIQALGALSGELERWAQSAAKSTGS